MRSKAAPSLPMALSWTRCSPGGSAVAVRSPCQVLPFLVSGTQVPALLPLKTFCGYTCARTCVGAVLKAAATVIASGVVWTVACFGSSVSPGPVRPSGIVVTGVEVGEPVAGTAISVTSRRLPSAVRSTQ